MIEIQVLADKVVGAPASAGVLPGSLKEGTNRYCPSCRQWTTTQTGAIAARHDD